MHFQYQVIHHKAWVAKLATVLAIVLIISVSMYSSGQNDVIQRMADTFHNIRDNIGVSKPLHENTKTAAFASKCNTEHLYDIQYSSELKASMPIPTGENVTCPRRMQSANFPIPFTGLLTFPGSGNTWTRHLLQELTGLPTGSSSIPDEALKENGFPFEGRLENVIAVKSHGKIHAKYDYYVPTNDFSRLIVVIRNPYSCFLSEYKRHNSHGSHTFDVSIKSGTPWWNAFISKRIVLWNMFFDDIFNFPGPVFVTFYEDLQSQLLTELIRLSEFLTSKDLSEFSFCCALKNPVGNFRRPKSNQTMEDIFLKRDRLKINEVIEKTAALMLEKHPDISRRMYSYTLPV